MKFEELDLVRLYSDDVIDITRVIEISFKLSNGSEILDKLIQKQIDSRLPLAVEGDKYSNKLSIYRNMWESSASLPKRLEQITDYIVENSSSLDDWHAAFDILGDLPDHTQEMVYSKFINMQKTSKFSHDGDFWQKCICEYYGYNAVTVKIFWNFLEYNMPSIIEGLLPKSRYADFGCNGIFGENKYNYVHDAKLIEYLLTKNVSSDKLIILYNRLNNNPHIPNSENITNILIEVMMHMDMPIEHWAILLEFDIDKK